MIQVQLNAAILSRTLRHALNGTSLFLPFYRYIQGLTTNKVQALYDNNHKVFPAFAKVYQNTQVCQKWSNIDEQTS